MILNWNERWKGKPSEICVGNNNININNNNINNNNINNINNNNINNNNNNNDNNNIIELKEIKCNYQYVNWCCFKSAQVNKMN